jgi:hypothetical protein
MPSTHTTRHQASAEIRHLKALASGRERNLDRDTARRERMATSRDLGEQFGGAWRFDESEIVGYGSTASERGLTSMAQLEAIVADYIEQASRWDAIPAEPVCLDHSWRSRQDRTNFAAPTRTTPAMYHRTGSRPLRGGSHP